MTVPPINTVALPPAPTAAGEAALAAAQALAQQVVGFAELLKHRLQRHDRRGGSLCLEGRGLGLRACRHAGGFFTTAFFAAVFLAAVGRVAMGVTRDGEGADRIMVVG